MRGEQIDLSCPFCDKGIIQCWYIPGALQEKRSGSGALGKGKSIRRSSDTWLIQSKCSNCGKNEVEIEKKLREEGII